MVLLGVKYHLNINFYWLAHEYVLQLNVSLIIYMHNTNRNIKLINTAFPDTRSII